MALISLLAAKGGGVTTSATALAAVWPREVLLAECDVAGGDLPYRLPGEGGRVLAQDRGVLSLAAAVRGQVGAELVLEHTQRLEGGLQVLVGPATPEQAAAMASAWTPLSGMFAGLPEMDVVADCGRVLGATPLVPVLRRSSLMLLVARASVEGMAHLRHGLGAVAREVNATSTGARGPSALSRAGVLLIGDAAQGKVARREVRQVLQSTPGLADVPVLGVLADDPAGARALSGRWDRRLDRSALVRSAREAAEAVFEWVHSVGQQAGDGAAAGSGTAQSLLASTRRGA